MTKVYNYLKFYCKSCKTEFKSSLYHKDGVKYRCMCRFCGDYSYRSIDFNKCKFCKCDLTGNQRKFCSRHCTSSYYYGLTKKKPILGVVK